MDRCPWSTLSDGRYEKNVKEEAAGLDYIRMQLPENIITAKLKIFNLESQLVRSVPIYERGSIRIQIKSDDIEAGTYIYSLVVDELIADTKRMVLLK